MRPHKPLTTQEVALRLLSYFGIKIPVQHFEIHPKDLDDILDAMKAANKNAGLP